jgi:predicted metal-dependent peptidase
MAKNDYSWRRINRRFKPMMLPGMWSEKLSNIAFAFDMSGSVSDADTKRYVSEMYHVMRMLKPDMLTLIQFDTKIKSVEKIKSVRDMMNVKLVGRGGTDIEDLMQWARKHKPTALVVFTDGEYRHPSFNPGCPILWMIHGRRREHFHCDFGTTIKFEV